MAEITALQTDGIDRSNQQTQIALVDFDKAKGMINQRAACGVGADYLSRSMLSVCRGLEGAL